MFSIPPITSTSVTASKSSSEDDDTFKNRLTIETDNYFTPAQKKYDGFKTRALAYFKCTESALQGSPSDILKSKDPYKIASYFLVNVLMTTKPVTMDHGDKDVFKKFIEEFHTTDDKSVRAKTFMAASYNAVVRYSAYDEILRTAIQENRVPFPHAKYVDETFEGFDVYNKESEIAERVKGNEDGTRIFTENPQFTWYLERVERLVADNNQTVDTLALRTLQTIKKEKRSVSLFRLLKALYRWIHVSRYVEGFENNHIQYAMEVYLQLNRTLLEQSNTLSGWKTGLKAYDNMWGTNDVVYFQKDDENLSKKYEDVSKSIQKYVNEIIEQCTKGLNLLNEDTSNEDEETRFIIKVTADARDGVNKYLENLKRLKAEYDAIVAKDVFVLNTDGLSARYNPITAVFNNMQSRVHGIVAGLRRENVNIHSSSMTVFFITKDGNDIMSSLQGRMEDFENQFNIVKAQYDNGLNDVLTSINRVVTGLIAVQTVIMNHINEVIEAVTEFESELNVYYHLFEDALEDPKTNESVAGKAARTTTDTTVHSGVRVEDQMKKLTERVVNTYELLSKGIEKLRRSLNKSKLDSEIETYTATIKNASITIKAVHVNVLIDAIDNCIHTYNGVIHDLADFDDQTNYMGNINYLNLMYHSVNSEEVRRELIEAETQRINRVIYGYENDVGIVFDFGPVRFYDYDPVLCFAIMESNVLMRLDAIVYWGMTYGGFELDSFSPFLSTQKLKIVTEEFDRLIDSIAPFDDVLNCFFHLRQKMFTIDLVGKLMNQMRQENPLEMVNVFKRINNMMYPYETVSAKDVLKLIDKTKKKIDQAQKDALSVASDAKDHLETYFKVAVENKEELKIVNGLLLITFTPGEYVSFIGPETLNKMKSYIDKLTKTQQVRFASAMGDNANKYFTAVVESYGVNLTNKTKSPNNFDPMLKVLIDAAETKRSDNSVYNDELEAIRRDAIETSNVREVDDLVARLKKLLN